MENRKNDHDLLIRIDEKVESVVREMKEMRNDLIGRVNNLESICFPREEADRLFKDSEKSSNDFEKRIRRLESWGFSAIGALTLLELVFKFLVR